MPSLISHPNFVMSSSGGSCLSADLPRIVANGPAICGEKDFVQLEVAT